MRIAFDQRIFLRQYYGGISRYICSLASELRSMPGVEAKIIAPLHFNKYLRAMPISLTIGTYVPPIRGFRRAARTLSSATGMIATCYKPDIFHETYYSTDDMCPGGAKRVVTVYDMIYELYPSFYPHEVSATKRYAVNRADHVICISQSTQRDLIELFDIPKEKTSVVYLAHSDLEASGPGDISRLPKAPYILYVGDRGLHKNFRVLVKAYAMSQFLRENFTLLCFGGGEITASERSSLDGLGVGAEQLVQMTGDDALLAQAYRHAEIFVYPSLYEGFGIPPLEAMSLGCPVAASRNSSITEVVGDAGEYFDAEDPAAMATAIERVLRSSELKNTLIEKGRKRAPQFSWRRCAEETLAVYRSLL